MESKIIIFLMFASLAQSFYDSSLLKVDYGLSADGVVVLEQIMVNQDGSRIALFKAVESLFDVIHNLDTQTDDLSCEVTEAFLIGKISNDLVFDSIILVLGESSSGDVENVRNKTSGYIDDVANLVSSALELAKYGNYSENQAAIEDFRVAAQEDLMYLTEDIYDLISNGLNTSDTEVKVVIESAKNESLGRLNHAINAIFNAIKLAGVAVGTEFEQRQTLETYIEELGDKTSFAFKMDAETKYNTFQTLYLNSQLNLTGTASILAAIIRAQIVSQARYTEGNHVLFGTLKRYLIRILYHLSADGQIDVSQDFLDLQIVTKLFDAGDLSLFASDLRLHPDAAATIDKTREEIHTINENANIAMYGAVASAVAEGANCFETLEKIEELRHAAVDPAPAYTDIFFNIIRNNITFESVIETQLVYLQNLTTYGAQVATGRFLDGVVVLANATCKGEVTDETFSAIEILLAEAIDGLQYFTQGLAAAALLVLQVIAAS